MYPAIALNTALSRTRLFSWRELATNGSGPSRRSGSAVLAGGPATLRRRLLDHFQQMREATVLVVVAGMEGALPSVVGGMVDKPVVAVPTSVGYGVSFKGLAALMAMLNSCAPGIAVVNIDNGFGAGYLAALIDQG